MPNSWSETRPIPLSLVFVVLGLVTAGCTAKVNKEAQYPSAPFTLESAPWTEPYNGPEGFPRGARRASLSTDPRTGGETYYARFPAGSHFALHWHAHAEYAVVLKGDVTHIVDTERQLMHPGDYVVIPPHIPYGWEPGAGEDVYLLIRRDGPADFNFVEQSTMPAPN